MSQSRHGETANSGYSRSCEVRGETRDSRRVKPGAWDWEGIDLKSVELEEDVEWESEIEEEEERAELGGPLAGSLEK